MAGFDAIYTFPSDELIRQGTVTLGIGTSPDTYGVERLTDDNPAHLFKLNETQGAIDVTFTVARRIRLLALVHATPENSEDVRLLADDGLDGPDWDNPAVDVAFPITGWEGSGRFRWPINSYLDLTDIDGIDANATFKYYRLRFGLTPGVDLGGTPLVQPLQIGQLVGYENFGRWPLDRGISEKWNRPTTESATAYRVVTLFSRGTTIYEAKFGIQPLNPSERGTLHLQVSDSWGRVQPWLFIPNGLEPRGYFVRWATPDEEITHEIVNEQDGVAHFADAVEELSRGLRPGT
jgi:hypothetical protein